MTFGERWRAAPHRRLQGILACIAVSAAVALPVVLLSVGGGVADHEIFDLEHSGYQIAIEGSGVHGVEQAHHLTGEIDGLTNVASASPILSIALDAFVGGGGPSPVLVEGIVPAAFSATESPEESGLFPKPLPFSDPTDQVQFANGTYAGPADLQVMVSTPFAQQFGLRVGDAIGLSATSNRSTGADLTISGTFGVPPSALGPTAVFALLVGLSELQVLSGEGRSSGALVDAVDTIQVALAPSATTSPAAIDAVAGQIGALVPYYGVSSLTDQANQIASSTAVLTGFYLALSSVGLIVGFVFMALVLLRRVESERRVIGVQRAIGVPARRIAAGWVLSGVVLGIYGAVGGLVGGIVAVLLLARFASGAVATAAGLAVFDPATLGWVAFGVVGMAALASAGATRASLRLSVPEALR